MSVIAVVNQKGGVGKTTTVLNLGACLANQGQRVLLVDLDPQAHLTLTLGLDIYAARPNLYHVLCPEGVPLGSIVLPTNSPGLDLVPSSLHLYAVDSRLSGVARREFLLRDKLLPVLDSARYEYVLIDCMSSLGLLTSSALAAGDWVLLPVQTAFYAVESLGAVLATIQHVQGRLNPHLKVLGILPTFHEVRSRQSTAALDGLRHHYGQLVFDTVIRRTTKLDEAPARHQSIITLAPSSPAARAYKELAREVGERAGQGS